MLCVARTSVFIVVGGWASMVLLWIAVCALCQVLFTIVCVCPSVYMDAWFVWD